MTENQLLILESSFWRKKAQLHLEKLLFSLAAIFLVVIPADAAEKSGQNDLQPANSSVGAEVYLHTLKVCIPAGTKIPIILKDSIDSDFSRDGDNFTTQTIEDLNIDGHIVLPSSTEIIGRIGVLKATGPTMGAKAISLSFDSAKMSSGESIRIPVKLVAHGGMVYVKRGLKRIGLFSKPITGPTIGFLNRSSPGMQNKPEPKVLFPFDDASLPARAVILMDKKSLKVHLEPLDELRIEFYEDLNFQCFAER